MDTHDLVGGPFAVIESDPGVFTSLIRKLGIKGLEVVELYDIEPWAVDHLKPHGLVFCFLWRKDFHPPGDFDDPAAERVWFANQLSDDACATHAILNVILNCPNIDIGDDLRTFRADTQAMSSVMRGLAITNSPTVRLMHNSFARPSDLRASLNNLTITTFEADKAAKRKAKAESMNTKPQPTKRRKVNTAKSKAKDVSDTEDEDSADEGGEVLQEETFHFIGYVPAHGKVWELDGLKSGPLEVGELPNAVSASPNQDWMDIVRPALRMKMEKYGGSGSDRSNIRFSLLAIVDDMYKKAHDEFELLKRERLDLEKCLQASAPEWEHSVDPLLLQMSKHVFNLPDGLEHNFPLPSSDAVLEPFALNFGARRLERAVELTNLSPELKVVEWTNCIQKASRANAVLEDEIRKAIRSNTDHVKRTFDYEPFIREYIQRLHHEGLLNALLDRDQHGRKNRIKKSSSVKGRR